MFRWGIPGGSGAISVPLLGDGAVADLVISIRVAPGIPAAAPVVVTCTVNDVDDAKLGEDLAHAHKLGRTNVPAGESFVVLHRSPSARTQSVWPSSLRMRVDVVAYQM